MSKKRPLSYSACTKYLQCPASFDYHYNQKIRPIKLGSPLLAGRALDEALNCLLLDNGSPMEAFLKEINSEPLGTIIPHVKDYDAELISDEKAEELLKVVSKFGYSGDSIDWLATNLAERIKANEKLSENQYKAADYLARESLIEKGKLALKAYKEQILPQIEKVYDVQKPSGPGYLDALVEWKDRGKIIADHKWVTRLFKTDAADYSAQLAMYAAEEKVNKVAFIAIGKTIEKNRTKTCSKCGFTNTSSHRTCNNIVQGERCNSAWVETIYPQAVIQVVHGDITEEAIMVAKELRENVQKAVDAKLFHCNVDKCNTQFGAPCIYKDLKWKGVMDGLVKKGKKK